MRHKNCKDRGVLVLTSAPSYFKFGEESKSLAQKFAAQVEWMRQKGINKNLYGEAPEPQRPLPDNVEQLKRSA